MQNFTFFYFYIKNTVELEYSRVNPTLCILLSNYRQPPVLNKKVASSLDNCSVWSNTNKKIKI